MTGSPLPPPVPPRPDPATLFAPPFAPPPPAEAAEPAEPDGPRRPGWVARVGGAITGVVGALMVITSPAVFFKEPRASAPVFEFVFQALFGLWMAWGGQYLFRKGWRRGHRRANVLAILPGAGYAALFVLALVLVAAGVEVPGINAPDGAADSSAGVAPQVHRFTGDGVTIDLPEGWSAGPGVDELPDALGAQLDVEKRFANLIRLAGYEEGPQILIIMGIPENPGLPLPKLTDRLITYILGNSDTDVIARDDTTVDGHPATRVELQSPKTFVRMLVFTWVKGDEVWVTMWVGGGANFDSDTPAYDAATHTIATSVV